jgi:hypothetical protein
VKLKSPSAYAFKTGLGTVRRGDIGDVGSTGDWSCMTEFGNVDARGVGSTSSSSSDLEDDGSEEDVSTEALLCTCLRGDVPNPSLDGVLKLNVLAGNEC